MKKIVAFWLLLVGLSALAAGQDGVNFGGSSEKEPEIDEDGLGPKAASREVNCLCQCSNLRYRDKYGNIHGNCASADKTQAVWCYVDPRLSRCADLNKSTRTTQLWSYEACATPDINSQHCRFTLQNLGFNVGSQNGGSNFNQGQFPNGGSNFNQGQFPNGGSNFNQGQFPNGGSNFNQGQFQNGGSNFNQGQFPNGGSNFNQGQFQNGGSNSGQFQNGGSFQYPGLSVDDLREANQRNAADHQAEENLDSAVNFGE